MTEDWVMCRDRSREGTYCIEPDGHEGRHRDKWGMQWPQEASGEKG